MSQQQQQQVNNGIDFEKDRMLVVRIDDYGNVETSTINIPNIDFKTAIGVLNVAILKLASQDIAGSAALRQQDMMNGIVVPQQPGLIVPR